MFRRQHGSTATACADLDMADTVKQCVLHYSAIIVHLLATQFFRLGKAGCKMPSGPSMVTVVSVSISLQPWPLRTTSKIVGGNNGCPQRAESRHKFIGPWRRCRPFAFESVVIVSAPRLE